MATGLSIREQARKVVDELPEGASWEDLIYRLYVCQSIEAGIKDADEGNVYNNDEIRREYGLTP